jgi:hypothetical protein
MIKSKRIGWTGSVQREIENTCKILIAKSEEKNLSERSRSLA